VEVTRTQSHCARIARRNPRTQCDADRRDAVAFDVFTLDSIAGRLHRLLLYYLLIIIQCHLRFRSLYGLFYNLFTFYFFSNVTQIKVINVLHSEQFVSMLCHSYGLVWLYAATIDELVIEI